MSGVQPTGARFTPPLPVVDANRRDAAALAGTLEKTPFPHVLLQLLTRESTGTLVMRDGENEEVVTFTAGVPSRVRPSKGVPSLPMVLAATEVMSAREIESATERAKEANEPLSTLLLRENRIDEPLLDAMLRAQVLARLRAISAMPPSTTFEFKDGADLAGDGDAPPRPPPCDPLEALLAATRAYPDRARLAEGLARLGSKPITLHPNAAIDRFALTDAERRVIAKIKSGPTTCAELLDSNVAPAELIEALLYALLYTRNLDLGVRDAWPVNVPREGAPPPRDVEAERRRALVELAAFPPRTHYEALGVARDATHEQLKEANETAAKRLDPTTLSAPLVKLRTVATRLSTQLARAYRTLLDPARRTAYDASVDRGEREARPSEVKRVLSAAEDYRRAEALAKEGDVAGAERLAARAVDGDPTQSEYLGLLGWLRGMGNDVSKLDEALTMLDTAVTNAPANDRVLTQRAAVMRKLGKETEALRDYRAALEANPANIDAARALGSRARDDAPTSAPTRQQAKPALAPQSTRSSTVEKPKSKTWLYVVIGLIVAAVVGIALTQIKFGPPSVRDQIMDYGIALDRGVEPGAPFPEEDTLDHGGEATAQQAVKLLLDGEKLDNGKSHSTQSVQVTALRWLAHYAASQHALPPPSSANALRDLEHGASDVPASKWGEIQSDWVKWLASPGARPIASSSASVE